MACQNCKYYVADATYPFGVCKRYPQFSPITVAETDWCGEYVQKPA